MKKTVFAASLALALATSCATPAPQPQPFTPKTSAALPVLDAPWVTIALPLPDAKVVERPFPAPSADKRRLEALEGLVLANAVGLDRKALRYALEARECAVRAGMVSPLSERMTIIDYTKPSSEKRLFIVDLDSGRLIFQDQVAHGSGSGGLHAERFSNVPDSHTSSLGLIEPLFEFEASSGRAVRLQGLEPGINDNIYKREIIVHPSHYIGNGRTGRSQGCQAVNYDSIDVVVNGLKGGLLYAYHAEHSPRLASRLIGCGALLAAEDMQCPAETARGLASPAWAMSPGSLESLKSLPSTWLAQR